MFKKVLTLIMGLGLAIGAQAQINSDDILFWVGHGDAHAIVAIQWDDDEVGLAWGVNYDEDPYLSVQDALDTIALYDPRFSYQFSHYSGTIMGFSSLNYNDGNYRVPGDLYCFRPDGTQRFKVEAGRLPSKIIFITD